MLKVSLHQSQSKLIGKAALGLAIFHLARRGHDFTITTGDSREGDLWVRFGDEIVPVEVKGKTAMGWNIRRAQLARVRYVIFCDVQDGDCFLVKSDRLVRWCDERKAQAGAVTTTMVAAMSDAAWHKEAFRVVSKVPRQHHRGMSREGVVAGTRGNRLIRKRLADGTIKTYEYPPYRKVERTKTDATTALDGA